MARVKQSYLRGSEWRKWDLHVHTPDSIINSYSGSSPDDKWKRFINDLEKLPKEFNVLGINDYIFLDGYRKILRERENGRLKNIDCIFPVIEFRLRDFCGTDSKLQKINIHVIFSDELDPGIIESQFLGSIRPSMSLDPDIPRGVSWSAAPSRDSLTDLGNKIIEAAPAAKRNDYGAAIFVGFRALVYDFNTIKDRLRDTHYFDGKYLLAVGKTEWDDIRWTDGAAAAKKDIINSADLVFVSSESPAAYDRARTRLLEEKVNSHLMDCSDAHFNTNSREKDRIGNCFNWVKANPTFEGLKIAIREFDVRVDITDEPLLIKRVKNNKTKFINSISFSKKPNSSLGEKWMDGCNVDLNPGLVAIIGNKGSGKSALSDTIGLLGNTRQYKNFSFLSSKRFRDPKTGTKAENFEAQINWISGTDETIKNLNNDPQQGTSELVKYIPQDYLEKICNEISRLEEGDFYRELKSVIFSHVDATETLDCKDLDSLIKYRTEASKTAREILVVELRALNEDILALEKEMSHENKSKLEDALKQKNLELDAHSKSKPLEIPEPKADPESQARTSELSPKIASLEVEVSKYDEVIKKSKFALEKANKKDAAAQRLLEKITIFHQLIFKKFIDDCNVDAEILGLPLDTLVGIKLNTKPLNDLMKQITKEQEQLRRELDKDLASSLIAEREKTLEDLKILNSQLNEPNRKYKSYLESLKKWKDTREEIVGNEKKPGSINYLKQQISNLDLIPNKIEEKKKAREFKVREIHRKITELADSYRKMFRGVDQFICNHPLAGKLLISFKVDIVPIEFEKNFFTYINQRKVGTFCGADEGKEMLNKILAPIQFNDENQTYTFLTNISDSLMYDRRYADLKPTVIEDQIKDKKVSDLLDFIFSLNYLQPRYVLEWMGKNLSLLSPGERGTLLLAFYLLIDQNDIPLAIDQPEGNLDNETVYKVLVECLKDVKKRRQVIIVTHNPNLAVVCDADQVIYSNIDRQNGNRITYTSGAIEDPIMNAHIVDVLEGTKPAFKNRDDKYDAVTSASILKS